MTAKRATGQRAARRKPVGGPRTALDVLSDEHLQDTAKRRRGERAKGPLVTARPESEQIRDRYAALYDFAPVGYVSIDSRANLVDINLAGAALLGRPRSSVLNLPFATMIVPEHLEALRSFLISTRQHVEGITVQTEVRVRKHPERIIRLLARPHGVGTGPSRLLTAMLDVTEERRLLGERAAAHEREQQRAEELAREVVIRTRAEARVKSLLERLVTVQEEERRRIARNLHDHLGQQMTALRLSIGALKGHELGVAELRSRLEAIDKIASQIDRDVDFLAWDLRPPTLDDVGLSAALHNVVREWSQTQRVEAEFHASADAIRLATEIESHLYRIVQEALNNVGKHAQATHVSVLLEYRDKEIVLIVEDDGRGFELDAAATERRGMGLTGMEERIALIGGQLEIESSPGKGTTIYARVPIRASLTK